MHQNLKWFKIEIIKNMKINAIAWVCFDEITCLN